MRTLSEVNKDISKCEALLNVAKTTEEALHFKALLYDLKNDPYSRRLIMNMYNHDDLYEMNLHPCAYSTTWNVTDE